MPQANFNRSLAEYGVIGLCLLGSVGLLSAGWLVGDRTSDAQGLQWQIVFLGLTLALAGQWLVAGTAAARKHQIAAASLLLAGAGVGVQSYYHLSFAPTTPFIVSYLFLFVAAETFAFVGAAHASARRTLQILRFGAVAWNVAWGVYFIGAPYGRLPDIANLYIAFSGLWTLATAVIAWAEYASASGAPTLQLKLASVRTREYADFAALADEA